MDDNVDEYIQSAPKWKDELKRLRLILLDCDLTETFKWRAPCYTFENENVAMIVHLKESCTLSFLKGALLSDPKGILSKPGENSQAARVIRFTNVREIDKQEKVLKAYVREAIKNDQAGRKVDFGKNRNPGIPEEFQEKLNDDPNLKSAFAALTPGRQRGYLLHFAGAK